MTNGSAPVRDESDLGAVVTGKRGLVDVVSRVVAGRASPPLSTAMEGDDAFVADVPAGPGSFAVVALELLLPAGEDAAEVVLVIQACSHQAQSASFEWKRWKACVVEKQV